jgi:hypothetical protein
MGHVLRDYQRKAFAYTMRTKHPFNGMGMRLGKNCVTIRRCKTYSDCKLFLIVCPNPAFTSWKKELAREGVEPPVELIGTRPQRLKKLLSAGLAFGGWYIINKEGWKALPEIAQVQWDVVILDEKFITEPTAKVTQFFLSNFRNVKHRWQLSGKIAPESDLQWITPLWFLNPKIWGQSPPWKRANYFKIRDKYFTPSRLNHFEWSLKADMKDEFHRIISKNCFLLDQKDVKLGGIIIYEQRPVKLPDNLRKAYTKLAKEFLLEIDGQEIARTIYAPGKHTLFRRLCGGFIPGVPPWYGKVDDLVELLTGELKGVPTIIWAIFTEEIDALERALGAVGRVVRVDGSVVDTPANPKRSKAVAAFQAGKYDWFLAHPGCFQYGEDLSRAKAMIYYSTPESADMREQSEKRFVNLTKSDSLLVIDMPCEDTVEEDIVTSLILKESRSDATKRIAKRLYAQGQ